MVVRHAAGSERLGETLRDGMKEKYELKVRGVPGGEWRDHREVTIFNRRLRWEDDEITYEANLEYLWKLVAGDGLLADSSGLVGGGRGRPSRAARARGRQALQGAGRSC